MAVPIKPVKITVMSAVCQHCLLGYRIRFRQPPLTVYAVHHSMPLPLLPVPLKQVKRTWIAGGVESMSRAPYVMGKSDSAFGRSQKIEDTTMGWRFINPKLKELYGVDTMPQTAENVAEQFNVNRADQDQFALVSQQRTASAQAKGFF